MKQVTTYVGIDAHEKDLFVAMLSGTPVRVFYEAGPCGYALQRQVTTSRVSRDVVAPAGRAASEILRGDHGIQGFAPGGRRLRRPWTPRSPCGQRLLCQQADACRRSPRPIERSGA